LENYPKAFFYAKERIKTMNKFMKILLLIVIITTMFMVFSINTYADFDELTI